MDEKVGETQDQATDRPTLREVSPEDFLEILEAHRKWVESGGKEGERADLSKANLQGANLNEAKGLIPPQVKVARNWRLAFYNDNFLKWLRLPPDHNERVRKKLTELEKENKATGAKP